MKILMKRLAGMAAIAALAVPSVAMASPGNAAAKLSLANGQVRAATPVKGANKMKSSTLINLAIFAAIVGGGLLLITGGDDDSKSK